MNTAGNFIATAGRLPEKPFLVSSSGESYTYSRILELEEESRETIEKYHVTNVFLKCAGDTKLHFMIPHKGILKNFNQGRGGYHHVAFCAKDITGAQKELERKGIRFISAEKQRGIGKFQFNFALPNIAGLNVELIEDPDVDWTE